MAVFGYCGNNPIKSVSENFSLWNILLLEPALKLLLKKIKK
jgi:hypothetical protein